MKTISTKVCMLSALLVSLFVFSCQKEDQPYQTGQSVSDAASTYSGEAVTGYFSLMCKVSQTTPGFFPPQVARAAMVM